VCLEAGAPVYGVRTTGRCDTISGKPANTKRTSQSEDEMNDEFETLNEQAVNEAFDWLQRVAGECGAEIGEDNTKVIERTLKEQRERIMNLKYERDMLITDLAECRALNAALVKSAGGAAVQMEVTWKEYGHSQEEISQANKWAHDGGWQLVRVEGVAQNSNYVLTVWQRPARESEGSE
jgi:hypothetical protein